MKKIKTFEESRYKVNPETGTTPEDDEENVFLSDDHDELFEIENKIIDILNEADTKLTKYEFERLSESIISYIDLLML